MMFGLAEQGQRPTRPSRWPVEDQARNTNERAAPEVRQYQTVPQGEHISALTVPDPDLKWNEEKGGHDFGEPDWEEFFQVIAGNGPCNKERLDARVKAWEEGAWVRDGLNAHAEKQAARRAASKIAAE